MEPRPATATRPAGVRWRRRALGVDHDLSWWIAVLFMVGSTLFALGSLPPYSQLVHPGVVGATFFIGSIFFTSAGASQLVQVTKEDRSARGTGRSRHGEVWWACAVQFVGTLLFNVSTYNAMAEGLSTEETNRLVWAPDMYGSIAFLIASYLGWAAVRRTSRSTQAGDEEWWVAMVNGVGSIAFMISAIASVVLPTTGEVLNTTLVNLGTFIGALCFFAGAYLLLPAALEPDRRPPGRGVKRRGGA